MLVQRIHAVHPFQRLRNEVDGLIGNMLAGLPHMSAMGVYPALNVWEKGEGIVAEAELPGMKLEDIEVVVLGDELTVKGQVREAEEQQGVTWHRRERGTGAFARSIRLPAEIDATKVSASFKDGVLTIQMPKAESAKPRKIEVKTHE